MGEIRYLFTLAEGIVSRLIRLSLSKGDGTVRPQHCTVRTPHVNPLPSNGEEAESRRLRKGRASDRAV